MKLQKKSLLFTLMFALYSNYWVSSNILNGDTITVVKVFMEARSLSTSVAFVCTDMARVAKLLMAADLRVDMESLPSQHEYLKSILKTEYNSLGVIVDLSCEGSIELLQKASSQKLFSRLHVWLILTNNSSLQESSLESLTVPLDSRMTLLQVDQLVLREMYQIGEGQPLTFSPSVSLSPRLRIPMPLLRDNYRGLVMKVGLTILQDPWENFYNLAFRHLNTWTKVDFTYTKHVARMLNFSMDLIHVNVWGWPDANGNYDGVIGQLQRGEVEFAAGGIFMQKGRLRAVDFAATTISYKGSFVFMQPMLPEVQEIYSLPFSKSVWYTTIGSVAVLITTLIAINKLEHKIKPPEKREFPLSWSDALIDAIGVVCQQGPSSGSPKNLSMRIVFLLLLLMSVFLFTAYSAIILTLLQAPAPPISTLKDLMASPLKLCMQDIVSNTKYVNETLDPDVKRLFREKLYTQPPQVAFTTPEIGIARVRKGLVGFHGDMASGYKIISDTFEEHEKCRLRYVNMISTLKLTVPVRKNSQYGEHLRAKMMWIREIGLLQREEKVWVYQAPKCMHNSARFVVIGFTEFLPVIEIYLVGVTLSLVLLIFECIVSSRKKIVDYKHTGHKKIISHGDQDKEVKFTQ